MSHLEANLAYKHPQKLDFIIIDVHILSDGMLISISDIKVKFFYMPLPRFIRPIQLGSATVRL